MISPRSTAHEENEPLASYSTLIRPATSARTSRRLLRTAYELRYRRPESHGDDIGPLCSYPVGRSQDQTIVTIQIPH